MKYIIIISIFISPFVGYSQMNIEQLINLPYGENYKIHESSLKSNFSITPLFMKGDYNAAFFLKYENVEFDKFGLAEYRFKYVQNKLVLC